MWTGTLKPESVLEVLRDFSFVLLGPLGEAPSRAAPGRSRKQIDGLPSEDWHLGELPPEIVAPVLLTCAIFVAHETETRLAGVNWDRRVLADGEGPVINTETLVWHLTFAEGETLRKMFDEPQVRPFRALLSALAADQRGLAAGHEVKPVALGASERWRCDAHRGETRWLAPAEVGLDAGITALYDEPVATGRLSSPASPTFGPRP